MGYKHCMIDRAPADPSRLMGNNVQKSLHWPVVHHQKDTPNGVCACWQIKWLSLVLASKSRIHMCARFTPAWRAVPGKNVLKPHLKQTWCIGTLDSRFLARMEVLLALYKLPYDPDYPVICYDERPCFLIGETVAPLAMRSGRVRKEHYAYEKLGSCSLLAMIEPLTGQRLAQVHPQRTKREYTLFCQAVAAKYPKCHQNQDGSG